MSGLGMKLGIACSICVGAVSSAGAQIASDWSEGESAWTTQSYWQDKNILQKYTFTPNKDDRVSGKSSMQVHVQVAAKRPGDLVELRLALPKPLDLSRAEAVELSLKVVEGSGLRARNAYFCSPGFKKLAIADWLDTLLIDGMRTTTLPPLPERLRAIAVKADLGFWRRRIKYACKPTVDFRGKGGDVRVNLFQALPNQAHVLELITVGDGKVTVKHFDIFEPPLR